MKKKNTGKNRSTRANYLFIMFTGLLILILPLIHYNEVLDISLMPQTLTLSIILLIFSVVLFTQKGSNQLDFSIFGYKLYWIVLAFLIETIISSFFSLNFHESWFDLIKTALFTILILIAYLIFSGSEGWKETLSKFVVIAAFVSFLIGFTQYINEVLLVENKFIRDDLPTIYNVKGLMGHKNEYSNSLLFMLPFIGYGIYSLQKYWKMAAGVALLVALLMIILLKTRAVWLAIFISVFISSGLLILNAESLGIKKTWSRAYSLALLLGILGLALIFIVGNPDDQYSVSGRIKSMVDLQSSGNTPRLNIWIGTTEMIKDNPWFGVGPGNWQLNFQPYVAGKFREFREINWGKPHNDFLWIAAEKGIIGLIIFLSIFLLTFYYLIKSVRLSTKKNDRAMALFLFAGVTAYLVTSGFSFPYERINHQVYLSLMLVASLTIYNKTKKCQPVKVPGILVIGTAGVISTMGILFGYTVCKQEYHLNLAIIAEKQQQWPELIRQAELSKTTFRDIDPLGYPSDYYIALAYSRMNQMHKAQPHIETAIQKFPNNVQLTHWYGTCLFHSGQLDAAQSLFQKALTIQPESKVILSDLGTLYFKKKDYAKALEALQKIPKHQTDDELLFKISHLEKIIETNDK